MFATSDPTDDRLAMSTKYRRALDVLRCFKGEARAASSASSPQLEVVVSEQAKCEQMPEHGAREEEDMC